MKAWKKMEKVFETQEEITAYITGKVKGGLLQQWKISMLHAIIANRRASPKED